MDLSSMKLEGLMDGIITVGEFLDKYAAKYPAINQTELESQLEIIDNNLSQYIF